MIGQVPTPRDTKAETDSHAQNTLAGSGTQRTSEPVERALEQALEDNFDQELDDELDQCFNQEVHDFAMLPGHACTTRTIRSRRRHVQSWRLGCYQVSSPPLPC